MEIASGKYLLLPGDHIIPNNLTMPFASLAEVERRLRLYEVLSNQQPQPFAWQCTRAKLEEFLKRLEAHGALLHPSQTACESPDTHQEEFLVA